LYWLIQFYAHSYPPVLFANRSKRQRLLPFHIIEPDIFIKRREHYLDKILSQLNNRVIHKIKSKKLKEEITGAIKMQLTRVEPKIAIIAFIFRNLAIDKEDYSENTRQTAR
jgi:hypothetical protein